MDRKDSCATLLRLPLAQNNKRKIADVDENASDGYDQPGRLVIDTSNNCSENMPAKTTLKEKSHCILLKGPLT